MRKSYFRKAPQEIKFRDSKTCFSNSGSNVVSIEKWQLKYYQKLKNNSQTILSKTSSTGVFWKVF